MLQVNTITRTCNRYQSLKLKGQIPFIARDSLKDVWDRE